MYSPSIANILSTNLVEMNNATNASLFADTKTAWNQCYGTTNKTLLTLPKRPMHQQGAISAKRSNYKPNLCNYMPCDTIHNQVLKYLDKVYNGKLNNVKVQDAFPLNYTPQEALAHIASNLHFKLPALKNQDNLRQNWSKTTIPSYSQVCRSILSIWAISRLQSAVLVLSTTAWMRVLLLLLLKLSLNTLTSLPLPLASQWNVGTIKRKLYNQNQIIQQ